MSRMPADVFQNALDRLALGLERIEVGAEYLHRKRALEARFGLIDRVLGGLRVVEGDARKILAACR